ncbi:MAG: transcription antitermination factor NusB [Chloroflexi bacterium]|nr:transcription antitermination factor NusB [Chloroflexota bacterium]
MAARGRRRGRIAVFQALYEADTSRHAPLAAFRRICGEGRLPDETATFARDLIESVLRQQDEIDGMITEHAPAWPVAQLSPVDRNILRLAICEMLRDNGAPVSVIINEAVELAKGYGSDKSAKFVNGVLGSVARQRDELLTDQPTTKRG